jgi:hypothetical protein
MLACCGDVPTLETLAAVSLLRSHLPDLKVVIDVIDRVPGLASSAGQVRQLMADKRITCRAYTREVGETRRRSTTRSGRLEGSRVNAGSNGRLFPAASFRRRHQHHRADEPQQQPLQVKTPVCPVRSTIISQDGGWRLLQRR